MLAAIGSIVSLFSDHYKGDNRFLELYFNSEDMCVRTFTLQTNNTSELYNLFLHFTRTVFSCSGFTK